MTKTIYVYIKKINIGAVKGINRRSQVAEIGESMGSIFPCKKIIL